MEPNRPPQAAALELLMSHGTHLSVARGRVVFDEGDDAHQIYVVARGTCERFVSDAHGSIESRLWQSTGPDLFGAEEVLCGVPRATSGRALTPCTLFAIAAPVLRELNATSSLVRQAVAESLGRNAVRAMTWGRHISFCSVEQRLARALLEAAATTRGEPRINLLATQEQLATSIGTSPRSVRRALMAWRQQGVIETTGRSLIIRDPQAFRAMAFPAGTEALS